MWPRRLIHQRVKLVLPGRGDDSTPIVGWVVGRRRRLGSATRGRDLVCCPGSRHLLPQIFFVLSFKYCISPPHPTLGQGPISWQARKDAAVAQDLLKVDAGRVREAAVVQLQKDTVAPMQKVQGRAQELSVPEMSSSSWAWRLPEQRSSGYGAASSPRSFTDDDFFFNDSLGNIFGSLGHSSEPFAQSSDPATWYYISILLNVTKICHGMLTTVELLLSLPSLPSLEMNWILVFS